MQGAAVDRGAAGISVVGGEDQRSRAGLAQRAAARDRRVERKRIREVRGDQAIVDDEGRYDRSGKPADAEVERAAYADGRTTGRIDHAAVGDRERADRIATAAATDLQPIERIQDRAGPGDGHVRAAVELIADGGDSAQHVHDAAVGNRERARTETANSEAEEPIDIPGRPRPGHYRHRRGETRKSIDLRTAPTFEHAPVGHRERAAEDGRKPFGPERSAVDCQPTGDAIAQREIAANSSDIAAIAGAG